MWDEPVTIACIWRSEEGHQCNSDQFARDRWYNFRIACDPLNEIYGSNARILGPIEQQKVLCVRLSDVIEKNNRTHQPPARTMK